MNEYGVTFSKVVSDRVVEVTDDEGKPLSGIEVVRLASNGTYFQGETDENGKWSFSDVFLGTITLLAAGEGWDGSFVVLEGDEWTEPTRVQLSPLPDGGSMIFERSSGYLPGLTGRLNPIRDSLGRFYIYGENLSFNESPEQPLRFNPGEEFSVSDAVGNVYAVSVLTILGRTALLRYRVDTRSPLSDEADRPHVPPQVGDAHRRHDVGI